jgi:hypothetical protein
MLNGDMPARLVAVSMSGSSEATLIPAKKTKPQYMNTILNTVALIACDQNVSNAF